MIPTLSCASNGFAIGSGGTLLVTNDGGKHWNLKSLGEHEHLLSIDFKAID